MTTPADADSSLQSEAFSRPFKVLAVALTAGCIGWLLQMERAGLLGVRSSSTFAWFLAASGLMVWTVWHIIRSKTTLGNRFLHQSWIWDKQMALPDMAYARLIRVRGLDWLIAPRLYVRTMEGKFAVFYAAEGPMIAEFERLERELAKLRGVV